MGETKQKQASRAKFFVQPDFCNLGREECLAAHRIFESEDEAKQYAETLIRDGWKRFKTKEAEKLDGISLMVFDVHGKFTEEMYCEAETKEIIKPSWDQ